MAYKRNFFVALASAAFFLLYGSAEGAEHADRVNNFLRQRTPLSATEQSYIMESLKATSPDSTQWILSGGGLVYSLAALPVQRHQLPNVQIRLEEMARAQASMRATHLMFLRAIPSERKERFENLDAVAAALIYLDSEREETRRLRPDLTIAAVQDGWAFALLRIRGELVHNVSEQIYNLPEYTLDMAYCAALYPKARSLFEQGRYEEALPLYLELHVLRWARPSAYLDAAVSFLRLGNSESAARLAYETVTELSEIMDDVMLERAGDILLEAEEYDMAELVFRMAIARLRQEY